MVDDELEVEVGHLRAGRAGAADRVLDPAQPPAECEVTLLNRVEEHRRVQLAVEGVAEGRVSLDLVHMDHGFEPVDYSPGDVRDDVLRVLERASDDVIGVARNIGQ